MACKLEYDFTYSFFYAIIFVGDKMKIAVDKNSLSVVDDKNEYIYLFDVEKIDDLLKTKLHCLNYEYCNYVDINLTKFDVPCLKKTTIKDKNWQELPKLYMNKIGIIIPNFNYEHTIEKCLKSILEQTYTNYQIIFVDDCSTDNSVKIAKNLLKSPHKVIELKQKRLNGGARNEAYLHLDDDVDYVYYVDSDDWLQNKNALRDINVNLRNKPDVLFVAINDYKNGHENICVVPDYKDRYKAIVEWSGSCGKVIKKELATRQECLYPEGTLKEDRNQHRRICIYMNSFNILQKPVYVWNKDNNKSVTHKRDNILWQTSTIRHYADTLQLYLSVKGRDKKLDMILKQCVNDCKEELNNNGDRQM